VLLLVLAYGVVRFLRYRLRLRQEVQISKLERQKTEELNHAKLQFFTNVTHELMTPLTIILTSLQNLNNGTGDNQTLYGIRVSAESVASAASHWPT
jgi:signal transduction histidine kinase